MKCDKLQAYKADVTIPVYGTIADADVYLKDKADEAIATLRGANDEKSERIVELQKQVDELDGAKKSAELILMSLLDCGLIKEWYFNGKFNAVLKADDPHLQIKELKAENAQLKKETEFMHSNCRWDAGEGCARLLGEKLAIIEENVKLKQKLQDHCIHCPVKEQEDDVVADKYNEIRRLKRALWLARASRAYGAQYWGAYVEYVHLHEKSFYEFDGDDIFKRDNRNNDSFREWNRRWVLVKRKCLAKAEEYK